MREKERERETTTLDGGWLVTERNDRRNGNGCGNTESMLLPYCRNETKAGLIPTKVKKPKAKGSNPHAQMDGLPCSSAYVLSPPPLDLPSKRCANANCREHTRVGRGRPKPTGRVWLSEQPSIPSFSLFHQFSWFLKFGSVFACFDPEPRPPDLDPFVICR